jgi:peptide/nickel transport system substrate-binding protein
MNIMEDVQAVDDRTIVVKWKQPYPDAEALAVRNAEFPAMPKHLLESALDAGQWESFVNHPFWTTEYVGAGPFKLDRWEPGSFMESTAFDRHVGGKAKIERIKIMFINNANTALANFLSGEIQLSADTALRSAQVTILKREWGPERVTNIFHPNQWRAALFQLRPELATPPALLDARVRKALAHAVDKEPINGAVYEESSLVADTMIPPITEIGKAIDRAITKYPYDLRRSEQLMAEAGYQKGSDGVYVGPAGRMRGEATTNAATDNEAELSIISRDWRSAGFEIQEVVVAAGMERDGQLRASFPGMWVQNTSVGESALMNHTSGRIPTPQNRYQGGNRGAWSNAEFDRLADMYSTELDRSKRTQILVDMTKIQSEDLPAISIFYVTQPWAFVTGLKGPRLVAPDANMSWDIETWEFR